MRAVQFAPWLIAGAAGVIGVLGLAHVWVTLRGNALQPRDPALAALWAQSYLHITRANPIDRVWLGFNHSHSLGALLFCLVWGWLALAQSQLLFGSAFLLGLGAAVLLVYNLLARAYWFHIPQRGVCAAAMLYLAGVICHFWAD